jgi:hypothetical protein
VGFGKFAPITSQLLARKGEAAPTVLSPFPLASVRVVEGLQDAATEIAEPKFVYTPLRPAKAKPHSDGPPEKPRRIVLNLTPQEYETLGLVAVKKGVTRHELAQSAIDAYFDWLVDEFGETCGCITGGATERCECEQG